MKRLGIRVLFQLLKKHFGFAAARAWANFFIKFVNVHFTLAAIAAHSNK
jgi:hypothetical protein